MSDQEKYIIRLRADLRQLRKDLANAKQIAKTASIGELVAKARLDRRQILTDIAAIRRQLQSFASEPITIKLRIDDSVARRRIAEFSRVAARRVTQTPQATTAAPLRIAPMMRRDARTIGANSEPIRKELTNLRCTESTIPIKIPIVAEMNQVRRSMTRIRRDAANVRGVTASIPVTFTRSPGNQYFLRRMASQIAGTKATVTPTINGRPMSRAMGAIQSEARALARTGHTVNFAADTREAMTRIKSMRSAIEHLANTRPNVTPGGYFGGRAALGAFAGASSLAGGVGMLAGAGAVGAGAAYGKVVSDGVGGLADLERSQGNLEIVLKDPDKAKDLIDELLKLDLQLPVDLGLLTDAAAKLAGAAFDSSQIKNDITSILDAASISTDGIAEGTRRIVRAFSQIRGAGRLLGEEINQLSESGIPIRAVIQQRFGMTADQVAEKSQAGEKGFDVDTILSGIIAQFKENYGGSLQKQSEQFYGQLDQLGDKYRALSRTVAEPIFEPLSNALKNLNEAIDSDSFDQLTAALVSVSEAAGPFIERLGMMAKFAIKGAGATVNAVESAAPGFASGVAGAVTTTAGMVGSAQRLFGKADDATGGLLSGAAGLAGNVADVMMPGRLAGKAVMDAGSSAVGTATDFVVDNQPKPAKAPETPKASLTDGLATVGTDIADKIGGTASMFSTMAESLGASLANRAGSFAESAGIDVQRFPQQATAAAADLERRDVLGADENKRFDSTVAGLPALVDTFAKSITNPKLAEAFKRSSFNVTQERDGNGRMMPKVELKELGELMSRGSVERTDFAGLNAAVQSNVDRQRERELAEKRTALAEKANEFLKTIANKIEGGPREATVAGG